MSASWDLDDKRLRDPRSIISLWESASSVDERKLNTEVKGRFWELLGRLGVDLVVTREYEHLALILKTTGLGPRITYLPLPHPSGVAIHPTTGTITIACTRNPNQLMEFSPAQGQLSRMDNDRDDFPGTTLVPVQSQYFPGCYYIHDLAYIDGSLHINSVGQNSVHVVDVRGKTEAVWWPKCIDSAMGPLFGRNEIQLNGIAAGTSLVNSYFTASAAEIIDKRPGDPEYPVQSRGVVFYGETREPVIRNLTRPHSPRLHREKLWVNNSGYGEFGLCDIEEEMYEPVAKLAGWTRGLCMVDDVAFVGTSRVIPRFSAYAPGLDVEKSQCGISAVDLNSGELLGSIAWPDGNQIFSVECVPSRLTAGFPYVAGKKNFDESVRQFFYSYRSSL